MKKFLSIIFSLFLLIIGAGSVFADDGGPNTDFWVIDHKTNCASVINPESVGPNAFLVFDYSAKVGQERGKPWSVVEKGKCYEVDDGTEDIYVVKIIKGNELETFSNYNLYKPTDSISSIFCNNTNECDKNKFGYSITPTYFLGDLGSAVVSASEEIHFTGITVNELFPTKYDFGYPITSGSSSVPPELESVINDPTFITMSDLYQTLGKQLSTQLQQCDTHIRTERQYLVDTKTYNTPSLDSKNLVWRLFDNKDVVLEDSSLQDSAKADLLNRVGIMGCKESYETFLKTHQTDFDKVDQLAEEVLLKYPDTANSSGIDRTIFIRGTTFGGESTLSDINSPVAVTNTMPMSTFEVPPQPIAVSTTLDEPTTEKKIDLMVHSSNPLIQIYIWLPLIALIGILAFLRFKRK